MKFQTIAKLACCLAFAFSACEITYNAVSFAKELNPEKTFPSLMQGTYLLVQADSNFSNTFFDHSTFLDEIYLDSTAVEMDIDKQRVLIYRKHFFKIDSSSELQYYELSKQAFLPKKDTLAQLTRLIDSMDTKIKNLNLAISDTSPRAVISLQLKDDSAALQNLFQGRQKLQNPIKIFSRANGLIEIRDTFAFLDLNPASASQNLFRGTGSKCALYQYPEEHGLFLFEIAQQDLGVYEDYFIQFNKDQGLLKLSMLSVTPEDHVDRAVILEKIQMPIKTQKLNNQPDSMAVFNASPAQFKNVIELGRGVDQCTFQRYPSKASIFMYLLAAAGVLGLGLLLYFWLKRR